MTSTMSSTMSSTPTFATLPASDSRAVFGRCLDTSTAVLGAVRAEQLAAPTPCADFDVRRLAAHLTSVLHRVAAMGRGEDPFSVAEVGPGDDLVTPWIAAARVLQEAWADDAVLTRPMSLPWMSRDGAAVLLSYLSEIVVHTWDLSVATGQSPVWDAAALEVAAAGIGDMPASNRSALFAEIRATMPEEYRVGPDPFADAVPVAEDATVLEQVVAWSGRDPRWTPPVD